MSFVKQGVLRVAFGVALILAFALPASAKGI